jgi:hypothetical protein
MKNVIVLLILVTMYLTPQQRKRYLFKVHKSELIFY